jgi:hypothetical protein
LKKIGISSVFILLGKFEAIVYFILSEELETAKIKKAPIGA